MRRYISAKAAYTVLIWFSLFVENDGFPQNLGLEEGDLCNDDGGICTVLNDCTDAKQQLMKTKRVHNLDRCGFLGMDEVVCCPPAVVATTPTTTTTTTKIVEKFPELINKKTITEGDLCNDYGGICTVLNDCTVAKQQLMKTKRFHNLDRCGFLGTDEVVCCPPAVVATTPTTTTTTTKIVEKFPEFIKKKTIKEGNVCNDDGGICTVLNDCTVAKQQLMKTKRFHNLDRCGFLGRDEVVCCPPAVKATTPTTTTTTTKIVDKFPEFIKKKTIEECEKLIATVNNRVTPFILGGKDAEVGEFPHMAVLGFPINGPNAPLTWQCGASIISDNWILSAGHCIINIGRVQPTSVRIGRITINEPNVGDAQEFAIKNITVHPEFNRKLSIHDIALLQLDKPIKRSGNVYPACLYYKNDDPLGIIATGWGKTSVDANNGSEILQKATLVPVPIAVCNATFVKLRLLKLTEKQMCAKTPPGRNSDTCQGDSGGPLQVESTPGSNIHSIVGVTSVGNGCGGSTPGVYTRVFSYLDWIENIVWP